MAAFDAPAGWFGTGYRVSIHCRRVFATGSEEWTTRLRLLETASPYAHRSNDGGEEGGDAFPEFEEQVFTLPAGLPGLPNDATLRGQLQAIGTPEARALDAAFAVGLVQSGWRDG